MSIPSGRRFGVRLHQLIGTQAALAFLLLGAAHGRAALALAALCAAGLLTLLWVRGTAHRLTTFVRFATRRRGTHLDDPAALLAGVAPGSVVTGSPALLIDGYGFTVLIELTGPIDGLPPLHTLVVPETDQPPLRLQLVLTAISTTRLTAVLALRAERAEGHSPDDLQRTLRSLTRRLTRRLRDHGARALDQPEALRVVADLAHAEPATDLREFWTGVRLGHLDQATFRCGPITGRLLPRILRLPATATTIALTAGPGPGRPGSLLIRLAAPDAVTLRTAEQRLRQLISAEGAGLDRWDGAHLPGLAATLPLGGWTDSDQPFTCPEVPAIPLGLPLGRSRHGAPVPAAIFRPGPTRVLLVGGLPCAQLIAFRALTAGARVTVHTSRPDAWTLLVHGTGDAIRISTADAITHTTPARPPSLRHPVLTVIDSGTDLAPAGRWQTTLTVRDTVTPDDVTAAAEADLLILQPLGAGEATLLGEALHLGDTAALLTRMRPTMVALVSRSTVRWAALAPTSAEKVLIGTLTRSKLSDKSR